MTDEEKKQLVDAVITQLKSEGTDVSNANIVSNANGIDYVVAYGKNGQIVRAIPTAISNEKVGASGYMNSYTDAGVYTINTIGGENLPIDNQGAISARLTVLVTESGGNKVITQVLNLNNNVGGEGNVYIRSCQNGEWKAWGKLQTNVEVGQLNTLDHLTDNGIYSGVFTDGTPTSVGTFYDTFVLIVINNYAVSIPTGNPQSISQLKYSLGLDGSISIASRKRDQYGYWDNWASLDEKSLVEEEKARAELVEQAIKEKAVDADSLNFKTRANVVALNYKTIEGVGDEITIPAATAEKAGVMSAEDKVALDSIPTEINKIKDGDTIVAQAREIHSRNGKTVPDSFLARTTAGSGTIGDGVASLKSVGGNMVKNLVDGTFGGSYIHKDVKSSPSYPQLYYYASNYNFIINHVYYFSATVKTDGSGATGNNATISINTGSTSQYSNGVKDMWHNISIVDKYNTQGKDMFIRGIMATYLYVIKPLVIDLTEMFGAGNEPDQATCDKLFGTMDALPQGLTIAKPNTFTSIGFNQFNPDNVLEGKAIVDNAIVSGDKKIAVIPCLPCKVGIGENNGYCIHGEFGEDINVYLTPLNPKEVDGELYMHELTKDATTDTYVPQIKGYMLVEVPTTANLCAHFLWSEDKCKRDSYEPYFESKIELPEIPQMSEWGLVGIQSSGTLVCDEIDFERGVYVKRIGAVDMGSMNYSYNEKYNVFYLEPYANKSFKFKGGGAILASTYTTANAGYADSARPDKSIYAAYNKIQRIHIKDSSYTDATSLKASLQGVMLYYELAEPEEYPLPKVDNNYISSDYGVELFDSVVPCNANNLYYMRSLAGETRNFLDRLMAGLGTSDATVVADRILAVVNPAEPANVEPETPIEE